MARKRSNIAFNLSFLDVMSCGFGAVVLVYLIMNHAIETEVRNLNADQMSEVNMLEEEVLDGEEGLVKLRNILSDVDFDIVEAQGLATRITEEIERLRALIESIVNDEFTDRSEIEVLQAEIQQLEEEVKKLRASSDDSGGGQCTHFYRRRQPAVPDRPEPGWAPHPGIAGHLRKHACGKVGQHHPAAQYGRGGPAQGGQMAALGRHC